jgi:hypothetical protein
MLTVVGMLADPGGERMRMADARGSTPFYESHGFQGAVAVVGLATAVWALSGAPRPWQLIADAFSGSAVAVSNTEIVLDTSEAMAKPFANPGEARFDAALHAIRQSGERDDEGLALRRTGAKCEETGDLLVDFGTGHKEEVLDKASDQQPEGRSNLVSALLEAIGDFRNDPRFHGPQSTRRILVFTSGEEECFRGDAAEKLETELRSADLRASFTLIGLRATNEGQHQLDELEGALEAANADVETRTPRTRGQLRDVVEEFDESAAEAVREGEEERDLEETTSG